MPNNTPKEPEPTVALSTLALELPQSADELAREHAGSVMLDELGRKALPVPLARALIAGEQQRRYAEAESKRKRDRANTERIAELQRRNPISRGVRIAADPGVNPAAAMTANAMTPQEEFGAGRRMTHGDWLDVAANEGKKK